MGSTKTNINLIKPTYEFILSHITSLILIYITFKWDRIVTVLLQTQLKMQYTTLLFLH